MKTDGRAESMSPRDKLKKFQSENLKGRRILEDLKVNVKGNFKVNLKTS